MKLIDADALIDAHYEYCNEHSNEYSAVFPTWSLKLMQTAPSVDIVRCGECEHWHSGICWGIPFSGDDASYIETVADDFCSYGCREEE